MDKRSTKRKLRDLLENKMNAGIFSVFLSSKDNCAQQYN